MADNEIKIGHINFGNIEPNTGVIPITIHKDPTEEQINIPEELPILALKNMVLFPGMVIPITTNRGKTVELLNSLDTENNLFGVVAQIDEKIENPNENQIYKIGTVAKVLQVVPLPDGTNVTIIQGLKRFEILEITTEEPFLKAIVTPIPETEPQKRDAEFKAIMQGIREISLKMVNESPNLPKDAGNIFKQSGNNNFIINLVASNLDIPVKQRQQILHINDMKARAMFVLGKIQLDYDKLKLKNKIQERVRESLDKQQKEYFLNQQIRSIQEELGEASQEQEIEELKQKASKKKWNNEIQEHFDKEISKFQRMNKHTPEYATQRSYIELLLELPWNEYSKDKFNLKNAQKILDKAHYGLDDIKKRIIEHIAVLKLRNDMKSPILCLYGPPGVGKTSIGKSIAQSLGRKYVRIALGGVKDESEIRGHRKTYIGAMPGRIIQSIKKAKTSNPVFLLDEIDKLSTSYGGDPSSALLEVLDPEQNNTFYDNFLEVGYDLSKVLFIATANNLANIQPALRDRMEIIEINGYTVEEKVEIAKNYLLPKQLLEHGLDTKTILLGKKQLEFIATHYTRESGVRALEKQIANIVRSVAKSVVLEEPLKEKWNNEDIVKVLGTIKYDNDKYENNETPGVVTGLAWTQVGGDILYIESIVSQAKGKGGLTMTGNLGNVMKESATIALEYIKANAEDFGINPQIFDNYKIHIHVPEGATPKDGPSAGIAMLTSIASSFTQRKVKKQIAMTGEITLRGKVLPVGGIKEKILAAKRADIKEIILCKDNKRHIDEINPEHIKGLTFHYVEYMSEVIKIALTDQKVNRPKLFEIQE